MPEEKKVEEREFYCNCCGVYFMTDASLTEPECPDCGSCDTEATEEE